LARKMTDKALQGMRKSLRAGRRPVQPGATSYEVARSTGWQFTEDCLVTETTETLLLDNEEPAVGACFFYLVRSNLPFIGSWGADSTGAEQTEVCP